MITKLKDFWHSLDEATTISKRELFLGVVTAALSGIVLGMILTPKKHITIGSNNCDNGCNYGGIDSEETDAQDI